MSFYDEQAQMMAQAAAMRRPEDKGGWLDPLATVLGGAGGFMLAGPAGAAAGANLGHAAGSTAHSVANNGVNAGNAMNGAGDIYAAWKQFAPYIGTFAAGGMVPDARTLEMLSQYARAGQPDYAALAETARSMAGSQPEVPEVPAMQQASHPTLEALSGVASQLLAAMPKPADPKNTRAIGAWLPAASVAVGAPASIAQARRRAANETATAGYEAKQAEYKDRMKAWDERYKTFGDQLLQNAKPVAGREPAARVPVMDSDWNYMLGRKAIPQTIIAEHKANAGTLSPEGYKSFQAAVDNLRAKDRADIAASGGSDAEEGFEPLSDAALRQQAILYAVTGENPLRGYRGTKSQAQAFRLMNEVARIFPQRMLARAQAAFKGDAKSRSSLTEARDGVEAFAASARKNLSMLEGALSRLPETGAPILNMPVRQFAKQFQGDPNVTDFETIRLTLATEYARLTQAMKVTGTALSVDAQKEIREAIPPTATVAQVRRAFEVMERESSNRAEAMEEMLDAIDRRFVLQPTVQDRPPLESFVR